MVKYYADILEKMTVGALCMGLFQNQTHGVIIGAGCGFLWQFLRILEHKTQKKKGA